MLHESAPTLSIHVLHSCRNQWRPEEYALEMELQAVVSGCESATNWMKSFVRAIGVMISTEPSPQSHVPTIKTYILFNSAWPSTHSKFGKFPPFNRIRHRKCASCGLVITKMFLCCNKCSLCCANFSWIIPGNPFSSLLWPALGWRLYLSSVPLTRDLHLALSVGRYAPIQKAHGISSYISFYVIVLNMTGGTSLQIHTSLLTLPPSLEILIHGVLRIIFTKELYS